MKTKEEQAIASAVESMTRPRRVKTGKVNWSAIQYATEQRNAVELEYSKRAGKDAKITMAWMYNKIIENWCERGLKLNVDEFE